jgi:hypothetical protein
VNRSWTPALATGIAKPRNLSVAELSTSIAYRQRNGLDARDFEDVYWSRWFYPVNVLALCLAAVPFAFGSLRSGGMGKRLFLGILFALGFWLLQLFFGRMAGALKFDYRIAYALPPIVMLAVSGLLFRRKSADSLLWPKARRYRSTASAWPRPPASRPSVPEPSPCSAAFCAPPASRAWARLYRSCITASACAPGAGRWRGRARSGVGGRPTPTRIPGRPAAATACPPRSAATAAAPQRRAIARFQLQPPRPHAQCLPATAPAGRGIPPRDRPAHRPQQPLPGAERCDVLALRVAAEGVGRVK